MINEKNMVSNELGMINKQNKNIKLLAISQWPT